MEEPRTSRTERIQALNGAQLVILWIASCILVAVAAGALSSAEAVVERWTAEAASVALEAERAVREEYRNCRYQRVAALLADSINPAPVRGCSDEDQRIRRLRELRAQEEAREAYAKAARWGDWVLAVGAAVGVSSVLGMLAVTFLWFGRPRPS